MLEELSPLSYAKVSTNVRLCSYEHCYEFCFPLQLAMNLYLLQTPQPGQDSSQEAEPKVLETLKLTSKGLRNPERVLCLFLVNSRVDLFRGIRFLERLVWPPFPSPFMLLLVHSYSIRLLVGSSFRSNTSFLEGSLIFLELDVSAAIF